MKIALVVGARPNYMKVAPILREIEKRSRMGSTDIETLLVHTGQHYDAAMSDSFFRDLGMPEPDEFLNIGSDNHARQTARVMIAFDEVCERRQPDAVLVVGDVNSTIACALVAAKRGIRVIHVEAGLRSRDRTMPEELNRVLTDQISDLLLVTSEDAIENLRAEGIDPSKIVFVGNPMIDSLEAVRAVIEAGSPLPFPFGVVTLHRPGNVDDPEELNPIMEGLRRAAAMLPLIFPVHPRTSARLREMGFAVERGESIADIEQSGGLWALPPLPYIEFLRLVRWSSVVLTDSGGIQEETTVLGVPCITLRPNTERPVTVDVGTNELVPRTAEAIESAVRRVMAGTWKKGTRPALWDGQAAGRIVEALSRLK
ncbi:MAG: UDP-N-acetylglucosamine 2-epimerase (non-hydrolyzing) [Acidobacteriota bacterium]